jgi:hypothetical protein
LNSKDLDYLTSQRHCFIARDKVRYTHIELLRVHTEAMLAALS